MKEVDDRVSAEMAKNPNALNDTIPACLIDTFEKFDARLHRTMIEIMRAIDSKPWNEWTLDHVPRFLGMKALGEHDPYPVMRRIDCLVISKRNHNGKQNMWVASLGDSEGSEILYFIYPLPNGTKEMTP